MWMALDKLFPKAVDHLDRFWMCCRLREQARSHRRNAFTLWGRSQRLTCASENLVGIPLCGEGIYPRRAAKQPPLFVRPTPCPGITAATPPNGSKLPRHRGCERPTGRLLRQKSPSIVWFTYWLWSVGGFRSPSRNTPSNENSGKLARVHFMAVARGRSLGLPSLIPLRSANPRVAATRLFRSEKVAFLFS